MLGPLMLLKESITRPKGLVRGPAEQQAVDAACRELTLYQFKTCPFCIKVRQEMRRLSLDIAKVDAQHAGRGRTELHQGSGHTKVPCLKITDASGLNRWLNDSDKIVAYLRSRFAPVSA